MTKLVIELDTLEQAETLAGWFEGAGEQDCVSWFEERSADAGHEIPSPSVNQKLPSWKEVDKDSGVVTLKCTQGVPPMDVEGPDMLRVREIAKKLGATVEVTPSCVYLIAPRGFHFARGPFSRHMFESVQWTRETQEQLAAEIPHLMEGFELRRCCWESPCRAWDSDFGKCLYWEQNE